MHLFIPFKDAFLMTKRIVLKTHIKHLIIYVKREKMYING